MMIDITEKEFHSYSKKVLTRTIDRSRKERVNGILE
jgi:hypothetical protein